MKKINFSLFLVALIIFQATAIFKKKQSKISAQSLSLVQTNSFPDQASKAADLLDKLFDKQADTLQKIFDNLESFKSLANLFGPIAGAFALIDVFLPKSDPVMDKLKEMDNKLSDMYSGLSSMINQQTNELKQAMRTNDQIDLKEKIQALYNIMAEYKYAQADESVSQQAKDEHKQGLINVCRSATDDLIVQAFKTQINGYNGYKNIFQATNEATQGNPQKLAQVIKIFHGYLVQLGQVRVGCKAARGLGKTYVENEIKDMMNKLTEASQQAIKDNFKQKGHYLHQICKNLASKPEFMQDKTAPAFRDALGKEYKERYPDLELFFTVYPDNLSEYYWKCKNHRSFARYSEVDSEYGVMTDKKCGRFRISIEWAKGNYNGCYKQKQDLFKSNWLTSVMTYRDFFGSNLANYANTNVQKIGAVFNEVCCRTIENSNDEGNKDYNQNSMPCVQWIDTGNIDVGDRAYCYGFH